VLLLSTSKTTTGSRTTVLDWQRGADNETIRIADFVCNLDLKMVSDKLAGLPAEPAANGNR